MRRRKGGTPPRADDRQGAPPRRMSRFFIIIFALFVMAVLAGFVVIGAFPPPAHRAPVEHVLSNDKFSDHH